MDGALDHPSALIQFGTPFVIKHVVNIGLDHDENSFISGTTGLDQFQTPLDNDGYIYDKSRWTKAGEEAIQQVYSSINGLFHISGEEFDEHSSKKRFLIFEREAKLALTAIFYGGRKFFGCFPQLLDSSIFIKFESIYLQYNQVLYYGTPCQYLDSIFFPDVTESFVSPQF
ncbi:MAG: staygreen family protein [Neobacillus sp.]